MNGNGHPLVPSSAAGLDQAAVEALIAAAGLSFAIIADQKAQNTAGGTLTSGAWRTRDLNTEVYDPNAILTISSNQFSLGAGTYLFLGVVPGYDCGYHQCRIYNITDSTLVAIGSTCYCADAMTTHGYSIVIGSVTIASSKTFELQQQCSTTQASTGMGVPGNLGTEVYSQMLVIKLG